MLLKSRAAAPAGRVSLGSIPQPFRLAAAVAALALAFHPAAKAASPSTFIIPAAEGYGLSECLAEAGGCGKGMADAWCDAHGLGPSVAYGLSDDMTGSIGSAEPKLQSGSLVISCTP